MKGNQNQDNNENGASEMNHKPTHLTIESTTLMLLVAASFTAKNDVQVTHSAANDDDTATNDNEDSTAASKKNCLPCSFMHT